MTAFAVERGAIDIAQVIRQLFTVLGRNLGTFLILSLVLVGLPSGVMSFLQLSSFSTGGEMFGAQYFYSLITLVLTSLILQGTLIYVAVQDANDRRASVTEALAVGLRAFLPLIAVSILMGIGLFFGFLFLIVPGVMLACAWCVTVPALVAERRGIIEAFGRSAELTRGNRWRIFALFLLYVVAYFILATVVGAIINALGLAGAVGGAAGSQDSEAALGAMTPFMVVLNMFNSTLSALLGATGAAVLYVELRKAREGLGSESLAKIFD